MASRFVMVDGINGSGKSTILAAVRDWSLSCGQQVFDLDAWCKEHRELPRFEEVADRDVFFHTEPTRCWIGAAMRSDIFRPETDYPPIEHAHAFSLDRLVTYRRLTLPALKAGKTVIQDRGFTTSLAYQTISLPLEEVLALPGNRLALENPPDVLILCDVPVEVATERLAKRQGAGPDRFEDLELQRKATEHYRASWFEDLFTSRGTRIIRFSTDRPIDEMKEAAKELVRTILTP